METWNDLCRCCLSAETTVSLLDTDQNVTEKFSEITTIEVKSDDGLPHKLCEDCNTVLNSAYLFRMQCIKMDSELKIQLKTILSQNDLDNEESMNEKEEESPDVEFANDPVKQLESIIKKEAVDSDDDYYYVLVIDDPDDKNNDKGQKKHIPIQVKHEIDETESENNLFDIHIDRKPAQIKSEVTEPEQVDKDLFNDNNDSSDSQNNSNEFVNTVESFLVPNSVPTSVPQTILENEEYQDDDDDDNVEMMNTDSQEATYETQNLNDNDTHNNNIIGEIGNDQNLIKILTTTGEDGTILLKSNDIQYFTGDQLITNDEDGDQAGQEVILCEGDESQFQILKYDGSELVIEYTDEGQIATVLQQAQNSFLCECGEQYTNLYEYQQHQLKHNPAGEHLCTMCGKGFESAEILTGHMVLHNVSGLLLQCPFCNQVMKRSALTQHIKFSHNNIKPQCEVCNKTFANPNNLKRHMMIHTGVKEFECNICFKRFHQKITMQTHRLTHMNPFTCPGCEMSFNNKDALAQHKDSMECPKTKLIDSKAREELIKTVKKEVTTNFGKLLGYACSLCKKMFSIESALERHIETTHIIDPAELLCSECGEVVTSKKDMQIHILSHDKRKNVKRFECSICGKGCPSQAMLIMHERVHTNERPFPCQLCPLKFKTKTHLRTHQLTHTREKKFGCSVCMKFFALKGNLVVHLRTHTGERPYICTLCGEAFIDSKYLKKHKLKKHAIDNVPWNQYLKAKEDE